MCLVHSIESFILWTYYPKYMAGTHFNCIVRNNAEEKMRRCSHWNTYSY